MERGFVCPTLPRVFSSLPQKQGPILSPGQGPETSRQHTGPHPADSICSTGARRGALNVGDTRQLQSTISGLCSNSTLTELLGPLPPPLFPTILLPPISHP